MKKSLIILFAIFISCQTIVFSQDNSTTKEINLSGPGWRAWLDSAATWQTDELYLPKDINLQKMPVNQPTCGWNSLYKSKGKLTDIPACFEQVFANGNPMFSYKGVGWFSKTINIPENWKGKSISLFIEKARFRVEVYVNEQLSGYDIVAETPVSMDISSYLIPGQNRIAFRITNPGGQRGWADFPAIEWGDKYHLPPGHDFGGIGNVSLISKPQCSIADVFVKNLLPANGKKIQLHVQVKNNTAEDQTMQLTSEIISCASNKVIFTQNWPLSAAKQATVSFAQTLTVSDANLWDTENPNLYYCRVSISGNGVSDVVQERFGFRTFEAKANAKGENNYYLNGKRIRIRSAIDWGFYAQTGFYATDEMAKKSVMNAKAIGNNCLSFHRRIGEPLVMKYADELGLLIYEEPGGMPGVDKLDIPSQIKPADKSFISAKMMPEKFKRMMLRDRNHPSVIMYNIANESATFDNVRKKMFADAVEVDNSRMVVNQSGGHQSGPSGYIPHLRPYSTIPVVTYVDDHTVGAKARFQESIFMANQSKNDSCIVFWGEVACYAGPANFYLLSTIKDTVGYDRKSFDTMGKKLLDYFRQNDFSKHPTIKSPADISVQAGRGLMYIDGRLSQSAMTSNSNDGFAINGWSETNQSLGDHFLAWYSAICDEGRNLKGPAADYAYWTKELQIAAFRKNGTYFNVADTAKIDIHLINEGKLEAGKYTLQLKTIDGIGKYTGVSVTKEINVSGGDDYSQLLIANFPLVMQSDWHGGYITLECSLFKGDKKVTAGTEQVLLSNRTSFEPDLNAKKGAVYNWPAADKAIRDAKGACVEFNNSLQNLSYIAAGDLADETTLKLMLQKVKEGTTLVIRFDSLWAEALFQQKILKEKVTQWGGPQKGFWNGNGWGYLDTFIGNQAIPSKTAIGTNSWEVPSDPKGFYPFVSSYPQQSHGAFLFRPDQLITLIGSLQYGKGKIILAPSYPVDLQNPFSDLLFYNMITK
jgi:hypothetical protein